MNKAKKNTINIVVLFILLVLIVVRVFISDKNCNWISAINFSGVLMAWCNIHFDVYSEFNSYEKIHFFTGVSCTVIVVLAIITVLVLLEIIDFSIKTNDIITLITLLISLPCELHKKIIGSIIKRGS